MNLLMAMNERHAVRDYTNRQRAKIPVGQL